MSTSKSSIPHLPNSTTRGYYTRITARLAKLSTPYSRQHVANVLQGKVGYSPTSLRHIAYACGVDVGWLADYIERVKK